MNTREDFVGSIVLAILRGVAFAALLLFAVAHPVAVLGILAAAGALFLALFTLRQVVRFVARSDRRLSGYDSLRRRFLRSIGQD